MTDPLDRAFGPPPADMGTPLDPDLTQDVANYWPGIVSSSGARPAALEAEIACSFCVGLNGHHAHNCIRPRRDDAA